MAGVISGVFTATGPAVAVLWLIVTFVIYREIPIKEMWNILKRSLNTLAIVMILIGTSAAFSWVLAFRGFPI